jgi:hypothetical protein
MGANVEAVNVIRKLETMTREEMAGAVVRVEKLEDDKWGVAIHIFSPSSSTVQ